MLFSPFPLMFFSVCLLIRLTLSSVGFELTRSLLFSVFLGFTYAYRHSLLTSCLQITVGMSLSKLQSYQASWFIPAIWVTHFCTSSQCCQMKYCKAFYCFNSTVHLQVNYLSVVFFLIIWIWVWHIQWSTGGTFLLHHVGVDLVMRTKLNMLNKVLKHIHTA